MPIPNYDLIPESTRETIDEYVRIGRPVGDFVEALLTNNLHEAFVRADENNIAAMFHIVAYLHNQIPSMAWGTPERFKSWMKRKAKERGVAHA